MGMLKNETKNQKRLSDENAMHKRTVEQVYEKWEGSNSVSHCNEGIAVREALARGASMQNIPKEVSPTGRVFEVSQEALSDRGGSKYGSANNKKGPEGKKNGTDKKMLSDR